MFLVLRRGYIRQHECCHELHSVLIISHGPVQPRGNWLHPYFKRSISSCVRPRLMSCMVGRRDKWGKAMRSFSQHSSSKLGTESQILKREPVLLFSWMFTTPPWMYMQPAWRCEETRLFLNESHMFIHTYIQTAMQRRDTNWGDGSTVEIGRPWHHCW